MMTGTVALALASTDRRPGRALVLAVLAIALAVGTWPLWPHLFAAATHVDAATSTQAIARAGTCLASAAWVGLLSTLAVALALASARAALGLPAPTRSAELRGVRRLTGVTLALLMTHLLLGLLARDYAVGRSAPIEPPALVLIGLAVWWLLAGDLAVVVRDGWCCWCVRLPTVPRTCTPIAELPQQGRVRISGQLCPAGLGARPRTGVAFVVEDASGRVHVELDAPRLLGVQAELAAGARLDVVAEVHDDGDAYRGAPRRLVSSHHEPALLLHAGATPARRLRVVGAVLLAGGLGYAAAGVALVAHACLVLAALM